MQLFIAIKRTKETLLKPVQWLVSVGHTRDKSRNCPWYFYHLCKVVLYPYGHARQPSALYHLCKYNTQ